MTTQCDDCIAGMIGVRQVNLSEWKQERIKFEKVIYEFNEKTKRFAVPHPGFANAFMYCPKCGKKIAFRDGE